MHFVGNFRLKRATTASYEAIDVAYDATIHKLLTNHSLSEERLHWSTEGHFEFEFEPDVDVPYGAPTDSFRHLHVLADADSVITIQEEPRFQVWILPIPAP